MAASSNTPMKKDPGMLARFGTSARRWASSFITPAQQINQTDAFLFGSGTTTVASLLGAGRRGARTRQAIYEKWSTMEGDPIISASLKLSTTSALGGHETTGDTVFIEKTAQAKVDKRLAKIVDEIAADVAPLLNKVAYPLGYTGAGFGDAYARIYTGARGLVDLHVDELLRPPMVQPFERGSRTVGYAVFTGDKNFERMDVSQIARLKMPRTQWVPQYGVVEKSMRQAITEDDIDNLEILPSMAGGSLLYSAEEPYDNLSASLLGLVGQRWMDSIDEQMIGVNLDGMTIEQQGRFMESVVSMFQRSKAYAEQAVKTGRPVMERIRHVLPFFNEKQMTSVGPANGGQSGRAATISIDDIMLHARLLSGALGTDLSMLGFADQLSGGLGDGGFFRVSAQAAENSRGIRMSLAECFNSIIDIHTMRRYGIVFSERERPWVINFYGSISALEAEKQRTRADAMNAGLILVQGIQQMKDLGATKPMMVQFLSKTMALDEEDAKLFANIVDQRPSEDGAGGPGGFRSGSPRLGGPDEETMDSVEEGPLGPVFTEYRNDPEGAIERLMREKTGDARAVWTREGLGRIDMIYGNSKGGLAHIAAKHPQMLAKLPLLLKRGQIVHKPGAKKVFIVGQGNPPGVAVVALDWYGAGKTWVVTSYEDMRGEFTGSLKRIDTEALDSVAVEVLALDRRTLESVVQADDDSNQGAG